MGLSESSPIETMRYAYETSRLPRNMKQYKRAVEELLKDLNKEEKASSKLSKPISCIVGVPASCKEALHSLRCNLESTLIAAQVCRGADSLFVDKIMSTFNVLLQTNLPLNGTFVLQHKYEEMYAYDDGENITGMGIAGQFHACADPIPAAAEQMKPLNMDSQTVGVYFVGHCQITQVDSPHLRELLSSELRIKIQEKILDGTFKRDNGKEITFEEFEIELQGIQEKMGPSTQPQDANELRKTLKTHMMEVKAPVQETRHSDSDSNSDSE
eukprot:scpid87853/ scgid7850/ 